jgi:hypothetical protein
MGQRKVKYFVRNSKEIFTYYRVWVPASGSEGLEESMQGGRVKPLKIRHRGASGKGYPWTKAPLGAIENYHLGMHSMPDFQKAGNINTSTLSISNGYYPLIRLKSSLRISSNFFSRLGSSKKFSILSLIVFPAFIASSTLASSTLAPSFKFVTIKLNIFISL